MRFLSTWQSIWRLWKKGQKYNVGKNDYNLIFHYFCDVINTNSVILFRNINKIIEIHEDIAWEWLCNIVDWKQLMVLVTMDTSWEMNHRQEKSSIKVLIHDMPQLRISRGNFLTTTTTTIRSLHINVVNCCSCCEMISLIIIYIRIIITFHIILSKLN